LADFEFEDGRSLEEHQLINGGQPVRALVTTTWRSGSTFLGKLNKKTCNRRKYQIVADMNIVFLNNSRNPRRSFPIS